MSLAGLIGILLGLLLFRSFLIERLLILSPLVVRLLVLRQGVASHKQRDADCDRFQPHAPLHNTFLPHYVFTCKSDAWLSLCQVYRCLAGGGADDRFSSSAIPRVDRHKKRWPVPLPTQLLDTSRSYAISH